MADVYLIEVTNTPDGDGDYCAQVLRYGGHVKTFYRKSRDAAIGEAKEWIERDRAFDPEDVERIEVGL